MKYANLHLHSTYSDAQFTPESLAQAEFTLALAQAAAKEEISVAVETSGYGKTEDLLALVPYCDTFLFDCKAKRLQGEFTMSCRKTAIVVDGLVKAVEYAIIMITSFDAAES